jgi:hypothetical protein
MVARPRGTPARREMAHALMTAPKSNACLLALIRRAGLRRHKRSGAYVTR